MPGGCVAVVEVGMKRLFLVNLPIFLSLMTSHQQSSTESLCGEIEDRNTANFDEQETFEKAIILGIH